MLKRTFRNLAFLRNSRGASLLELGVSLLLMSLVGVGSVGSVAVGARAGALIEEQDAALITARSQAEFIASQPTAASYPDYPSIPKELDVSVTTTGDLVCPVNPSLQCFQIEVFRDGEKNATLDVFKSKRFLEVTPTERVVPKSGGLERVTSVTVPDLAPQTGFTVIIPQVFSSTTASDIVLEWGLTEGTRDQLRSVALFEGQPSIAAGTPPPSVSATLKTIGQFRDVPSLSATASGLTQGDYTIYLFNDSNTQTVVTQSFTVTCVCEIAP